MKTVEEFGKTVEEARGKALRALGVTSADADVEVEVLSEGDGRKMARVKATLKREAAPPPAKAEEAPPPVELEEAPPAPKPVAKPKPAAKAAPQPVQEEDEDEEILDEEDDVEGEEDDVLEDDLEDDEEYEDGEAPADILEDILDLMHLQASVDEDEIDGQLYLNIVGPDLGILIGKHGQTLEALQFILNLIVNHNQTERLRVTVDVGGYRQRRERTLRELALRMARRAADEQATVSLEPMLANERRIIHLALADHPHVETYSQGEEPMRKVIIAPRR